MSINKRLGELIDFLKKIDQVHNQTVFAKKIGKTKSEVTEMKNGNRKITEQTVRSIIDAYPFINFNWLWNGEGEMTKSVVPVSDLENVGIPLIPINAVAGVLSGNSAPVMDYECEHYAIPMFPGAEFLIHVSGDSMQPKYYSGDIVACKRLPLDTFFQWGKVYVVDSEQGVIIKRVQKGHDEHHVTLESDNCAYAPFEIPRSKIQSIALVIGVVRAE